MGNKTHEAEAIRTFIRLALLQVSGEPTPGESPDFELTLKDGTRVGVEVTEVADPMLAKGRAAVVRLQTELADRFRKESLHVAMHLGVPDGFGPLLDPRHVRKQHVVALLSLAREHLACARQTRKYQLDELRHLGVQFLADVTIGPGSIVTVGHRAHGRRSAFVQKCIDVKNEKARRYRNHLPGRELWLLLLAGVEFRSSVWSAEIEFSTFQSAFDRVFCFDAIEQRVFPVKTTLNEASEAGPAGD